MTESAAEWIGWARDSCRRGEYGRVETALAELPESEAAKRAAGAAVLALYRGDREAALAGAAEALERLRAAGDDTGAVAAAVLRAEALLMLDRHEESLAAAESSREAAVAAGDRLGEANALRATADALLMLGRHEESLAAAESSREAAVAAGDRLGEAHALRANAHALYMLDRHEESLAAAESSREAAVAAGSRLGEANARRATADALRMLGRHEESLAAAESSLEAAVAAGDRLGEANALTVAYLAAAALGDETAEAVWLARVEALDPERAAWLRSLAPNVRQSPGIDRRLAEAFERTNHQASQQRKVLGREPSAPDGVGTEPGVLGEIRLLRKWASYTTVPLLRDGGRDPGPAGGYFVRWGDWGLVIDPGLGFGAAFREQGLVPRNIDAVLLTHNHIDHVGEVQDLVTVFHEMSEEKGVDHRVSFYHSTGALEAFASSVPFLPQLGDFRTIRPGVTEPIRAGDQQIGRLEPVRAQHRDLRGHTDAAIGFVLALDEGDQTCRIGCTSDTGYYDGLADAFADVDVLIVHIGGIYKYDAEPDVGTERPPWHLGYRGVADLLAALAEARTGADPLIVVSEWGEELKEFRGEICRWLATGPGRESKWRVWPAELGARIALMNGRAEPVCDCGQEYATRWIVEDYGEHPTHAIRYRCERH